MVGIFYSISLFSYCSHHRVLAGYAVWPIFSASSLLVLYDILGIYEGSSWRDVSNDEGEVEDAGPAL